jgi:hypothetical protein
VSPADGSDCDYAYIETLLPFVDLGLGVADAILELFGPRICLRGEKIRL